MADASCLGFGDLAVGTDLWRAPGPRVRYTRRPRRADRLPEMDLAKRSPISLRYDVDVHSSLLRFGFSVCSRSCSSRLLSSVSLRAPSISFKLLSKIARTITVNRGKTKLVLPLFIYTSLHDTPLTLPLAFCCLRFYRSPLFETETRVPTTGQPICACQSLFMNGLDGSVFKVVAHTKIP
ncbi:hypothetical protein EAG_02006 [Camponotus floridanus]|uniref:Uncharacterized protein n=1 Tax=Camponotus floridanus TaxID=104421 RepID=E2AYY1_CAMFO|nr:hypothetical protein EAG_02006 [Camponotus floridanus]